MDILTIAYMTMAISVFLVLFGIIAAIMIICLLMDIRMEIRTANDFAAAHADR